MSTAETTENTAWVVRPEAPQEVAQVQAVVTAAFGDPAVADLLTDMRRDNCWRDLSFVVAAEADPRLVIGHVAYTRGWVDAPDRLVEVLILSPMSVHRAWQGRGAGTALIHRSLSMLAHRREPLVFLEGSPAYYGPLGFQAAMPHGFARPSPRIPEGAFQLWRLHDLTPPEASLTGALIYPDVIWRHDAVGLR